MQIDLNLPFFGYSFDIWSFLKKTIRLIFPAPILQQLKLYSLNFLNEDSYFRI